MSFEPYKNEFGSWVYPTLPNTVRRANKADLVKPSGKLNVGKIFLCWSYFFKGWVQSKIYETTTIEDINRMLNDQVIYVKK